MTHIYRIDLRSGSIFHPNEFKLLYAMNHISDLTSIRTIEPTLQLIVLSSASSVDMVHWPSDAQGCGNLRTSMSISTDDMEEVVGYIVPSLSPHSLIPRAVEWRYSCSCDGPLHRGLQTAIHVVLSIHERW